MKKSIIYYLILLLLSTSFYSCSCSKKEESKELTFHFPYFDEESIDEVYLFDNVTITTEDQSEKIYFDDEIEKGKYQSILISEVAYYLATVQLEQDFVIVDYDLPIIKISQRFKFPFFSRNSTCGLVYFEDFREKQNEFLGKDTNYKVKKSLVTIKRRDFDSKMKTYEYKVGRVLPKSENGISRTEYIEFANNFISEKYQPPSSLNVKVENSWGNLKAIDIQYKLMRFLLGQEIFRDVEFDDILFSDSCKIIFENESENFFDFEELISTDVFQIVLPTYDHIFLFKVNGLIKGSKLSFYSDLEPIQSFKIDQSNQNTIKVLTYKVSEAGQLIEIKNEIENGFISINDDFFELNLGNDLFLFSLLN